MVLPDLRHFRNAGIYTIFSDPVEALHGKTWVPAVYTDKGWATADGANLLIDITEWRHAIEKGQQQKDDRGEYQNGDGSRQTAKASGSNRVRQSRKKPQT